MRQLTIVVYMLVLAWLLSLSRTVALPPVYADPLPEDAQAILEKSLSIQELDREIGRITDLKQHAQNDLLVTEQELIRQETAIAIQREKAGRTLRAYYMGSKDIWLHALFNVDSITDLVRVWDVMSIVLETDRQTMDQYASSYQSLRSGYAQLQEDRADLAAVENELIAQRDRIIRLQAEVERAIADSGKEDMLRRLVQELQAYWRNVGLYEVKQHFRALADAMHALPDWISNTPGIVKTNGLRTTLTITDEQLNTFLREQDSRFNDFAFSFNNGLLVMTGDNGNIQVKIEGRYIIENEPENALRFHVDALIFNGFSLPDTTRAELEREFDLGFYPQKLIKSIKARSVSLENGTLTVQLSLL